MKSMPRIFPRHIQTKWICAIKSLRVLILAILSTIVIPHICTSRAYSSVPIFSASDEEIIGKGSEPELIRYRYAYLNKNLFVLDVSKEEIEERLTVLNLNLFENVELTATKKLFVLGETSFLRRMNELRSHFMFLSKGGEFKIFVGLPKEFPQNLRLLVESRCLGRLAESISFHFCTYDI